MEKLKVGVIGGTGMVGQRFVTLIANHPWFELKVIAASKRSAGKTYEEAVSKRWALDVPMPECAKSIVIKDASDVASVAGEVDFVFSAVDMKKEEIRALEEACHQLDLAKPIWLDATVSEFKRHAKARFYQDNFIEEIPFDYLEIQVIEED